MSILNSLSEKILWDEFYQKKEAQGNLHPSELKALSEYISEERYKPLVESILAGQPLSLPTRHLINKVGKSKKRVVYTYNQDENYVLKLLTHLLYRYDDAFPDNLYSFRRHFGVRRAFSDLTARKAISRMYSYKVDIQNYFNSGDIDLCISEMKDVITDDPLLVQFIEMLLREDRVIYNGEVISDRHGMMSGVPISSFLANVYLRRMDQYFEEKDIPYARYSDDILVFATDSEKLSQYVQIIKTFLRDYGLTINPEKEVCTRPGEAWTFLGLQYKGGVIDIAPVSVKKVKAKFRRKTRALLRWKRKKGLQNIHVVKAFIHYINRFFCCNDDHEEMTWTRWYFPLITTDKSLKVLDQYTLELIRYLMTEKHQKSNYNFRYDAIKALGYQPLVTAYYRERKKHEKQKND